MFMYTRRCFAHVDQALFAVERHCEHTIVFDCGGEDQSIVNKAIDEVLSDEEIIDILFVSHYDSDHINGIQHLLMTHQVRHIVLPMIAEPAKAFMVKTLEEEGDAEASNFALNPAGAIRGFVEMASRRIRDNEPRLHFVLPWDETANNDLRFNENEGYPIVRDIDELDSGNIPAGVALSIGALYEECRECIRNSVNKCPCRWIYLPFNRSIMTPKQEQTFWAELQMPTNSKCDDVLRNWDNIQKDIKTAWSTATGIKKAYINDYSMTLYSGCRKGGHFSACLFTGDYNASAYIKDLHKAYKCLWGNISVIQVPHHGSEKFFHKDLIIHHGAHIISNRNQPKTSKKVNDTIVLNQILSRGEFVAKSSHQHINIPGDYYGYPYWIIDDCWHCRQCRHC